MFDSVPKKDSQGGNAAVGPVIPQRPQRRCARLASFAGGLALLALFASSGYGPERADAAATPDGFAAAILASYSGFDAQRMNRDVDFLTEAVIRHTLAAARQAKAAPAAKNGGAAASRGMKWGPHPSFAEFASRPTDHSFEDIKARPDLHAFPGMQERSVNADALAESLPPDEIQCLAQNIYFEARGEPHTGKLAVGQVVMNRVASKRFPNSVCDVVRQGGEQIRFRCQFSWWCDGKSDRPQDSAAWEESLALAEKIYSGQASDPTHGALWYHADYVAPYWASAFIEGPTIGHHIFYQAKPKEIRTQLATSSAVN